MLQQFFLRSRKWQDIIYIAKDKVAGYTVIVAPDADGDVGLGFGCNDFEAYPLHQFDFSKWDIGEREEHSKRTKRYFISSIVFLWGKGYNFYMFLKRRF